MTALPKAAAPQRTCIGCRQVSDAATLVRIVLVDDPRGGNPVPRIDAHRSAPGRGAWLHPQDSCLVLALQRGGFPRAFRCPVNTTAFSDEFRRYTHHDGEKVEETMDIR